MKNKKEKLKKENVNEIKDKTEKDNKTKKDNKIKKETKKVTKVKEEKVQEKKDKEKKEKETKKEAKNKNSLQKQKLCKVVKSVSLKKQLDDYKKLVSKPNYVCEKCGRVAQNKESLCHPVLLEKK